MAQLKDLIVNGDSKFLGDAILDHNPTADMEAATKAYVDNAIDDLPAPMQFKGSLGTGGTITSLPAASAANAGFTYKVITEGTYVTGETAKVGDMYISNGSSWVLIPSGDDAGGGGTVTSVGITNGGGLSVSGGPITTSGNITVSHADTSSQASVTNSGRTYIQSVSLDTYGHVTGLTSGTEPVEDKVIIITAAFEQADLGAEFLATFLSMLEYSTPMTKIASSYDSSVTLSPVINTWLEANAATLLTLFQNDNIKIFRFNILNNDTVVYSLDYYLTFRQLVSSTSGSIVGIARINLFGAVDGSNFFIRFQVSSSGLDAYMGSTANSSADKIVSASCDSSWQNFTISGDFMSYWQSISDRLDQIDLLNTAIPNCYLRLDVTSTSDIILPLVKRGGTTSNDVILYFTCVQDSILYEVAWGYLDGTNISYTFTKTNLSNTTYTFTSGTNGFTVTPSGGTAQTVTVTPSIANNITGTGTSGSLAKFNGANTITAGPALDTSATDGKYLSETGSWTRPLDGIFKGTCSTAAATTTKAVVCPEFTSADLVRGAIVFVTFTYTNSGAVASLNLNVNSTGAKRLKYMRNAAESDLPGVGYLRANMTYRFVYTGSVWVCDTDYDANTYLDVPRVRNLTVDSNAGSLYRYELCMFTGDNTIMPYNKTSNAPTTYTKAVNTCAFDPFRNLAYYNTTTTVSAGAVGADNNFCLVAPFDCRYSFNIQSDGTAGSTALTASLPVYIKAKYNIASKTATLTQNVSSSNYLERSGIVQVLPTTDPNTGLDTSVEFYIYIFVGIAYSLYQICLFPNNRVYAWNASRLAMKEFDARGFMGASNSVTIGNVEYLLTRKPLTITDDGGTTTTYYIAELTAIQ